MDLRPYVNYLKQDFIKVLINFVAFEFFKTLNYHDPQDRRV